MGSNRNNNDRRAAQVNAALMHAAINLLQDPQNLEEQCSTRCNAECTPVVVITTDDSADAQQTDANNAEDTPAANSTQRTPTAAAHAWHYTAMSAATFTLSALLGYIATEAIVKRIRGRN